MNISASEFVKQYCKKSGITEREFYETQVPMPDPASPWGWAAVSNNPLSIKAHVNLYSVRNTVDMLPYNHITIIVSHADIFDVEDGKSYAGGKMISLDTLHDYLAEHNISLEVN
ncbi:hypothetical protein ACYCW3_000819 [Klebsiella quasipneumoniae]